MQVGSCAYFCQNCDWDVCNRCLNRDQLMNREGVPMTLGQSGRYYCGRLLGRHIIRGSDGRCGPNNGPQCPACLGFSQETSRSGIMERLFRRRREVEEDVGRMVMRMFHPVNGRLNFEVMGLIVSDNDNVNCFAASDAIHSNCSVPALKPTFQRPHPEVMAAMLAREQALRLSPETQSQYADLSLDHIAITTDLQIRVVREFGYPDSYVQLLRAAAQLYSRDELPFEALPHYVRYNRSAKGELSVGSAVPDVPLYFVGEQLLQNSAPVHRLPFSLVEKETHLPMVIAAGSFT